MAEYNRLEVLDSIVDSGLIPIYYHDETNVSQQVLDACVDGGAKVVEFTNRGDGAWQLFNSLLEHRQKCQIEVSLGAGSIVDAATASMYINSGADFIVGPTFNPDISTLCNRRKVPYIPGCGTVTEISRAEAAGAELVKIFPGEVLGPKFVSAVRGPQPWTKMVVTGGVSPVEANIKEWFKAGVTAIGLGSKLIRQEWVMAEEYNKIAELVAQVLTWIKKHKEIAG